MTDIAVTAPVGRNIARALIDDARGHVAQFHTDEVPHSSWLPRLFGRKEPVPNETRVAAADAALLDIRTAIEHLGDGAAGTRDLGQAAFEIEMGVRMLMTGKANPTGRTIFSTNETKSGYGVLDPDASLITAGRAIERGALDEHHARIAELAVGRTRDLVRELEASGTIDDSGRILAIEDSANELMASSVRAAVEST